MSMFSWVRSCCSSAVLFWMSFTLICSILSCLFLGCGFLLCWVQEVEVGSDLFAAGLWWCFVCGGSRSSVFGRTVVGVLRCRFCGSVARCCVASVGEVSGGDVFVA